MTGVLPGFGAAVRPLSVAPRREAPTGTTRRRRAQAPLGPLFPVRLMKPAPKVPSADDVAEAEAQHRWGPQASAMEWRGICEIADRTADGQVFTRGKGEGWAACWADVDAREKRKAQRAEHDAARAAYAAEGR